MIRLTLENVLNENGITKNALAREAKIRPNAIYELCDNQTKRLDLSTFNKVLETLREMSGKDIQLFDVLKYIPDKEEAPANE